MEYIETAMSIVEGVINYEGIDEKMKKLKRKLKHLRSREEDVKEELKHAEGLSLKKPRKVVENWLKNVGNIKNQVEQMEQQIQETRWFSHLPLERKMGMLTEQVAELDQQGQFPEGLTLEAHGSQHVKFITTKLIGQTFQEHKDVIWECLRSNNVSKIGIYGMGGVGKTTLLIDIHNELLDHPNFSVSWVTASQEFRIHKLQNDIAKTIKLELENDDDGRKRAAQLAWHLRNMNNFVLILDDVWQHFPLDRVGIPTGGNGCKLILTSRSLEVCRRIGCEEHIKVQPLSEKDAWELFTEKLGHETLSHEIEPIAKLLAKKCSGLPLGIITMAGCMREVEDISEWSDALGKMNESVVEHDDNMSTEVFQVLKYSYDRLKDPKVKQCFLYCSLFPEDFEIERETLVEYFIDERLVDGMRSRQAELNRGLAILNKLENVCLLEGIVKANGKRYVKMHDLVRSMAIKIAKVNSPILVKAGEQLKEIPAEEKWSKDFIKVSLMENNISDIPDSVSPNCPKLSTLMLNHNHCLRSIPDCFFSYMPQLSVLDLSYTHIENLPTSISDLVNLTALRLEGCMRLQHIPSLANLKVLRRLNLSLTGITEVPQGMEMLFNLRYLNLDGTGIKMIPDCIFAKLSCLQYLGIDNVITISSKLKVRGVEMVKLRKLETLKGQLYDMEDFNAYVRWRENNGGPNNYLLQVGQYFLSHSSLMKTYDRAVCLKECKISKSKGGEDSLVLPTDVQFLHIRKCNDASSLCDIASLNNATQLRDCEIHICEGMENMVCCCSCSLPLLQSLQSLWLFGLSKLRALIGGEICCASKSASPSSKLLLQTAMFSSLTRLQIFDCPKLKRLFTPVLLSNLKHLEVLTVEKCEQMVEIIGEASDESDDCINQQEPISSTRCMSGVEDIAEWSDALEKLKALEARHGDDMGTETFELTDKGGGTNYNYSKYIQYVKMHDLVRCMASQIARVNQSFLVKAGERLRDIPGGEKWEENLTKVSLMENSKSTIPTCGSAKFPRLTILTLNGNLKSLRRLNLRWAGIRELPKGMEMMLNLRYLNLIGIRIEMIPDGILPKLSCLQYLGILALEKGTLIVRGEGVVKLGNLETFQMESYDIHDFNTYARWQKNNKGATKNYLLLVGPCRAYELSRYGVEKYERCVGLDGFNFCISKTAAMPAVYVILFH
nr:disease resistance protein SUMM2-like [Ziziphus jujuba var. spinosa]